MKTFEQFMSEAADDKDPYWGLFEINKVANQAVFNEEAAKHAIDSFGRIK